MSQMTLFVLCVCSRVSFFLLQQLTVSSRNLLFTASPRSFADEFVSVGVGQLSQLIQNRWQKYDFFVNAHLPNELASRGFGPDTDIPGYLFREDGLKLWDALGEFTTNVVHEVYRTDADVAKDIVLRLWADEMTDPEKCGMPGFPTSFEDKETLATTLQCLWWVASCLHNALNAPQYDVSLLPCVKNSLSTFLPLTHTFSLSLSLLSLVLCLLPQQTPDAANEHGAIQGTRGRHVGLHF